MGPTFHATFSRQKFTHDHHRWFRARAGAWNTLFTKKEPEARWLTGSKTEMPWIFFDFSRHDLSKGRFVKWSKYDLDIKGVSIKCDLSLWIQDLTQNTAMHVCLFTVSWNFYAMNFPWFQHDLSKGRFVKWSKYDLDIKGVSRKCDLSLWIQDVSVKYSHACLSFYCIMKFLIFLMPTQSFPIFYAYSLYPKTNTAMHVCLFTVSWNFLFFDAHSEGKFCCSPPEKLNILSPDVYVRIWVLK